MLWDSVTGARSVYPSSVISQLVWGFTHTFFFFFHESNNQCLKYSKSYRFWLHSIFDYVPLKNRSEPFEKALLKQKKLKLGSIFFTSHI